MEIQLIKISEEERQLLSTFYGEDLGNEIDFNRLMPVWVKVNGLMERLFFESEFDKEDKINTELIDFQINFHKTVDSGDCKKAQEIVTMAINWYNQQKK